MNDPTELTDLGTALLIAGTLLAVASAAVHCAHRRERSRRRARIAAYRLDPTSALDVAKRRHPTGR